MTLCHKTTRTCGRRCTLCISDRIETTLTPISGGAGLQIALCWYNGTLSSCQREPGRSKWADVESTPTHTVRWKRKQIKETYTLHDPIYGFFFFFEYCVCISYIHAYLQRHGQTLDRFTLNSQKQLHLWRGTGERFLPLFECFACICVILGWTEKTNKEEPWKDVNTTSFWVEGSCGIVLASCVLSEFFFFFNN